MVSGFVKNVVQYTVVAKYPGQHPGGLALYLGSHFPDIDCPISKRPSMISNFSWSKMKATKRNSRQPLRIAEKTLIIIACIVDLFSPPGETAYDPFAATMSVALVAIECGRRSKSVELKKIKFKPHDLEFCGIYVAMDSPRSV